MGTQYSHIDLAERRRIQKMRDAKVPVAVIAAELGRHCPAIHREIRRNVYGGPIRGHLPRIIPFRRKGVAERTSIATPFFLRVGRLAEARLRLCTTRDSRRAAAEWLGLSSRVPTP